MANSKKRCRSCKSYKLTKEMKQAPNGGYFCNTQCMTTYAFKNKEKGKQIKYRAQKAKVNTDDVKHQHVLTQKSFNKMRVLEEKKWFKDKGLEPECISCGKIKMDWCCGHFKTRGSQGNLRYDKDNTFLQCNRYCNMALSGNIAGNKTTRGYTQGLYDRFGDEEARRIIEYCETSSSVRKWTGAELKEMRSGFNKRIKELEDD